MMRDDMKVGDLVMFYHSNCKPPHIAGIARVKREGYPDFTSWDTTSKYYDAKSSPDNPRWFMVDIEPVLSFENIVDLPSMREEVSLDGMPLLRKGQRLSVQPVPAENFEHIILMAGHTMEDLE